MSGIPHWAVKGARVVCVDDEPIFGSVWLGDGPREGAVYTIAGVRYLTSGAPVIDLVELMRCLEAINEHGGDCGYAVWRFRPLIEDSDEDGIEARIFRSKAKTNHSPNPRQRQDA